NPTAITEELATHLHSHIGKRLQTKDSPYAQEEDQKTVISLPTLPDFRKFFENIPFITEPNINIIYDIFTLEPLSDSSLFFKLGDERLYLKPLSDLKRSMIEIFIKTNTHFFEIHHDEYYTLVPHCPELCYQHNAEKPPLETSLKALKFLRQHYVHFNQYLFMLFYQNNVRNFSSCLLEDVDFSEVDIKSLDLRGSTLYFQKEITPNEFIFLFKSCDALPVFRAIESLENIEEALFKEARSEKSPIDKGILLFYAIGINSSLSITRLLAAGADATGKNLKETPIQHATLKFKRWECVKALTTAKTEDDSLILAMAASEKQWDIVEILLDTKTDPNYQIEQDDDVTALNFAARTNNVRMVQKLLEAGANPTLKTYKGKQTALEEAIAAGHHECIRLLQNVGFKKLYHLIQKSLPSSIKSPFLQFYSALRKDSFTSPLTKNVITEHFICFLEESVEKYKEEKQDEKENEIRESLYKSRNDLQERLEGKPPVFNGLTTALQHLFESILPENHPLRRHRPLRPLHTLPSDSSPHFVR
ncbi:MAG: Ankyrin repeat (3 copies), partial [Gammaproteobacteria bacterium]|nr:Ankyrin repeat (3 copies) [Gammaproteobacteria bacterium]